jgi:hypothetical protein
MDELVVRAIHNDFRGPAVDLLFFLKEKRDEKANVLVKNKMGYKEVELNIREKDPFFILEYNDDFAEKTKNLENIENEIDLLGVHPRWINYE